LIQINTTPQARSGEHLGQNLPFRKPGVSSLNQDNIMEALLIYLGDRLAGKIPMKLVHGLAASIFALLGVLTLAGVGASLGF
jgi:hypothetical protein